MARGGTQPYQHVGQLLSKLPLATEEAVFSLRGAPVGFAAAGSTGSSIVVSQAVVWGLVGVAGVAGIALVVWR